jgi:hypothetical protein
LQGPRKQVDNDFSAPANPVKELQADANHHLLAKLHGMDSRTARGSRNRTRQTLSHPTTRRKNGWFEF